MKEESKFQSNNTDSSTKDNWVKNENVSISKEASDFFPTSNETIYSNGKHKETENHRLKSQCLPLQIFTSKDNETLMKAELIQRFHLRQPFKILTDIWGVLTSYTFRGDLFAYYNNHLREFLLTNLENNDEVRRYLDKLTSKTKEQLSTGKWSDMPPILTMSSVTTKEKLVDSVICNLNYREGHKSEAAALMTDLSGIRNLVWNDGYRSGRLKPHTFADVVPNFQKWHHDPLFIKIYTFASGPPESQRLFLSASEAGPELTANVTACFDAQNEFKYKWERFRQIVSSLDERVPANLFYLTDSPRKGEEARKAGLTVFIVIRPGNKQYKPEVLANFRVVYSLDQFDFFVFK